jgi:hypothetical protein
MVASGGGDGARGDTHRVGWLTPSEARQTVLPGRIREIRFWAHQRRSIPSFQFGQFQFLPRPDGGGGMRRALLTEAVVVS